MCKLTKNWVVCFMVIYYVHIPDPIIKLLVSVIQWSNIIWIYQKMTWKSSEKWLFLGLKFDLKSWKAWTPLEHKRCAEAWLGAKSYLGHSRGKKWIEAQFGETKHTWGTAGAKSYLGHTWGKKVGAQLGQKVTWGTVEAWTSKLAKVNNLLV